LGKVTQTTARRKKEKLWVAKSLESTLRTQLKSGMRKHAWRERQPAKAE